MNHVVMHCRKSGERSIVEVDYAVLHVVSRSTTRLPGHEVRRRLLAGETFQTGEHDFYSVQVLVSKAS